MCNTHISREQEATHRAETLDTHTRKLQVTEVLLGQQLKWNKFLFLIEFLPWSRELNVPLRVTGESGLHCNLLQDINSILGLVIASIFCFLSDCRALMALAIKVTRLGVMGSTFREMQPCLSHFILCCPKCHMSVAEWPCRSSSSAFPQLGDGEVQTAHTSTGLRDKRIYICCFALTRFSQI